MSITTTSGTVLNGLYVGSSTPVANQKGLLIDNKYFIPLVEGSSSGTDTSDATAVASDIIAGKTAYTVDGKVTGTLPKLTVTYDDTLFIYTAAHDGYLNAGDQVLDFSAATSGTASGAGMLQGDTAWVNGQRIVGEIPIVTASISGNTVTVPYGYHESDGTFTVDSYTGAYTVNPGTSSQTLSTSGKYMSSDVVVSGDSNLLAENIKKGVSIFGIVGTLESGGGSSAEYYKCASVSSGASQPEGYNLTVEFYGFTINEAGTSYDRDSEKTVIRMTMQDTSASGLDRVWVSDDGAWKLMKYELPGSHISWGLYKTSRGDFEYFVDADCVSNQDAMSAAWENGETYSDDVNPWVLTRIRWSDDPAWTDLTWTVSPAVSGGSTWSGYKAVFNSDTGTWSFSDTVTEGLNYSAVTPVPGFIYNADCTVLVKSLYVGVAEIPTDNLFYYLPLSENYNTSVGAETSIGTGTLSFTSEDSIKCAKFDGTQYLNTTSLVNQPNMTFSFWAKKTGTDVGVVIGQPYNSYIALSSTSLSLMTNATDTSVNVNTTTWHHYAVKKVGVQWSVYVDGVLEHTWSGNDFDRSGNTMRIGVHGYNQSYLRFNGYLTSIRIYYKALTDAEIVALSKELSPTKQ